jgi:uncharacterized protein YcbK (DUF882 family)
VSEQFNLRAVMRAASTTASKTVSKSSLCCVAVGAAVATIVATPWVTPARADEADQFFVEAFQNDAKPTTATLKARRMTHGRSNLGADISARDEPKSLAGTEINWIANSACLHPDLRAVVAEVAATYGTVTVNSTCRSPGHNAAIGGAEHSFHLSGNAVDFRVHGNIAGAAAFLSGRVGGYKNSGGGLFHIDTGPRRAMN